MCQCTAKRRTSTGAMTKGGRANIAKVVLLEAWSNKRFGRLAAAMAIGKAMAKAMICGRMISSRARGEEQLGAEREGLADDARRGLVRGEGLAQVALEDVAHPDEVLSDQRLVEPELAVDGGDVLRGLVRSEDRVGRVAGEEVDQEKGRDRDEEDDDDEQYAPLCDVTAHVALLPPFVSSILPNTHRNGAPTGGR